MLLLLLLLVNHETHKTEQYHHEKRPIYVVFVGAYKVTAAVAASRETDGWIECCSEKEEARNRSRRIEFVPIE